MASNNSSTLGYFVRSTRLERHITLRAFAKRMQISPSHLSAIEQDQTVPAVALIERMAQALEVDADMLCALAGKLTPAVQKVLTRTARTDPKFFRTMIERIGGAL